MATLGFSATAASAHATLLSSDPAQSSVYPAGLPPHAVTLTFDERVRAQRGSVAVYDARGVAVPVVAPSGSVDSRQIRVQLPHLGTGTFVVVWRIVSDDGHPEQGDFSFSVGRGGAAADAGKLLAARSSGRATGLAYGIDRGLVYLCCLVFLGGLMFVRLVWPEAAGRREIRRLLLASGLVAVAATLVSIPLAAAYTGQGASAVIESRIGVAALVRAGLVLTAVALLVVTTRSARRAVWYLVNGAFVLAAVGAWVTFAYAGHGDTGRWPGLGVAADLAHLGAASLWLGGVVALAVTLRDRLRSGEVTTGASRFSKVALPAIGVVVLSGVIQGWRQIGSWAGLWQTTYARLLITKVLIVVALVIVASAARGFVRSRVPVLRAALGGDAAAQAPTPFTDLRDGILVEIGLAVAVLAVTAALVVTVPGREAELAAHRPVAQTLRVDAAGRSVGYGILVQPALPGENTFVVAPRLLTGTGFLPTELTARLTSGTSQTVSVVLTPLEDGRWVGTALLPTSGTWHMAVTGRTSPGTDFAATQVRIG